MKRFALGVITTLVVLWLGFLGPRQPQPSDFTQYSAVLLTAVAVLVTTLGVFIAILAVFGYSEMKRMAQRVGEESALRHVEGELKSGSLGATIESRVLAFLTDRYDDNRLNQMIEARIDQLLPGRRTPNAIDRALDSEDPDA